MDPYKVLNVKQGASQDEIKSAYRKLVKEYHPDQYKDNPLEKLAEEKLAEINKAYDMLKSGQSNSTSDSSNNSGGYTNFSEIRRLIQMRNNVAAENMLNSSSDRNAEWHFLYGMVMVNKGWYDVGLQNIEKACAMDSNNLEYKQTINQLRNRSNGYGQQYRTAGGGMGNGCDCCMNLWCLDSLCECTGGDLIGCC